MFVVAALSLALPDVYVISIRPATTLITRFNATVWPGVNVTGRPHGHLWGRRTHTLSKGQIGCALAHLTLLEHFLRSNKKQIIVFEDDAQPVARFEELYTEFAAGIDCEWCQLVHHPSTLHLNKQATTGVRMKAYGSYGTVAYSVNRHGALKLVMVGTPIYAPIDEMWRCQLIPTCKQKRITLSAYMPSKLLVPCPLGHISLITGKASV